MKDRVIGLDIGASSIKAAQVLRTGPTTYVVEKQAARTLPSGVIYDGQVVEGQETTVAAAIRSLLEQANFETTDVILGLNSSSAVFMFTLTVPMMRPEDVDRSMPHYIVEQNPNIDPSENLLSYTVVGKVEGDHGRQMLEVLVFSVHGDYANQVARIATAAGLNVVGSDLNALAAMRAMRLRRTPESQIEALVDIGSNVTMTLLHHNGVPKLLSLDPQSAGAAATAQIADALGMDEEDATQAGEIEWYKVNDSEEFGPVAQARAEYSLNVAAKLSASLDAFLASTEEFDTVSAVTVVGGGALLNGLTNVLHEGLGGVPLSYADLDSNITGPNGAPVERIENRSGGDYLVAIGLGTGARI